MKTKIYILSLLGGLLLTMVACLNDGKDDYLDDYESFLCILNSNEQDITFYNTGESAAYNITIDKGGNDLNMLASATLKVLNEFDIEYYNNENKTNFKPLPADCYELPSDMTVSFGEKELYKIKTVTFHPEKISVLSTGNFTYVKIDITNLEGNFALPLEITSTKYAFSGENTVIIGLQNSAPKITLTPDMMTLIGTNFADGNGFADWLDGKLATQAQVTYGGGAPAFPHQVDIHLNSAISKLRVRYATRNTNQHPTKFIIYASNDGANWKEIKVFTAEADGLPVSATTYYDTCPTMLLGDSYTYVRFEVHSSTNPSKFNTWALSEFELYGK